MAEQPYRDESHAIHARNVEFEWDGVPLHYLPGEPFATQFFNVAHIVLPEGERAMAAALSEALPLIDDERLHEEAVGFVGQEAMHAASHEGFREHLTAQGVAVEPVLRRLNFLIETVLTDGGLTGRAKHAWLCERLGMYAAMEHFTAVFGQWVLDADQLDELGMHPMMLDLVRWHGAEEIEHRSVVFDVYQHVDGSYARRVRTALVASSTLAALWFVTAAYLSATDPAPDKGRPWPSQFVSAVARGVIPSGLHFLTEIPVYLKPGFHPSQMGNLDKALRYLALSPAARAADGR